jgi:protein-L-isoaspartate(D-aspartate) O-methyltransferase
MHSKFHRRSPVLLVLAGVLLFSAFTGFCQPSGPSQSSSTSVQKSADAQRRAREQMVQQQIAARGVRDPRVLQAMRDVPRHLFVPPEMQQHAYQDTPLPIGYGQTISQPYIVGFMTEALKLKPQDRVLEVGTGSGYQAAILSVLVREVYSIEIVEPLATQAAERLKRLGYANVKVRAGDGYQGWPEAAPFDAIIVTAAPDHVPKPLLDQLAPGGRLVIPVGEFFQTLKRIVRTDRGFKTEELLPVRFVPMTGEAQK